MCDEIKVARLEVRHEEHMRNFAEHCADEDRNFDALFNQVRKLEDALTSIDKTLSNQKSFIGAIVFYTGALFAAVVAAVQYFAK